MEGCKANFKMQIFSFCLLLLSSGISFTLNSDQIAVSIDTAEFGLEAIKNVIDDQLKEIKEIKKATGTLTDQNLLKQQFKLINAASAIKTALAIVQTASVIASFLTAFLVPSELEVVSELINKRFNEVNRKLDLIYSKMDNIEDHLKSEIKYHTFLTNYIAWESSIKNGAEKLKLILETVGDTKDPKQKVKLAEEFITYLQPLDVEGKIHTLHRITTQEDTDLTPNIFTRYIDANGCDIQELSGIMFTLKMLMISAARQTVTYYHFKGLPDQAGQILSKVQKYMAEIRTFFRQSIYDCMMKTAENAQRDTSEILSKASSSSSNIIDVLYKKLSSRYPWYGWAVAKTSDIGAKTRISILEERGTDFFKFPEYADQNKGIIVAWQDVITDHVTCTDIARVKAFVSYLSHDDYHVVSSYTIPVKQKCPRSIMIEHLTANDRRKILEDSPASHCTSAHGSNTNCISAHIQSQLARWNWIAIPEVTVANPCSRSEICNEHGTCKFLTGTNYVCICEDEYDGKNCEEKIQLNDEFVKYLAVLRKMFQIATGVPTVVDVFFEVRNMGNNIETILNSVKDQLFYTQNLVKHSEILYQVSYVAGLYKDLMSGNITMDSFGQQMEAFMKEKSGGYLLARLKGLLLGDGIADVKGKDFFNTFKSNYLAQYNNACSYKYSTDITVLLKSLASLDQAFVEALLVHKQWKIQNNLKLDSESLDDFLRLNQGRQGEYQAYWIKTSCSQLKVTDLNQNFCDDKLSYEGMVVPLSCSSNKTPSVASVQCIQGPSGVQWSAVPQCNYYWLAWGSWSECSVSCGEGTQYRTRDCSGPTTQLCGSDWKEVRPCSKEKCCQQKFGKFECRSGKCILTSDLCDGVYDCPNNEDESEAYCPDYIRSGKVIALKNECGSDSWLSCDTGDDCRRRTCPGGSMDTSEWDNCGKETFTIYALGRQPGDPIHFGDTVGLKFRGKHWLSCWVSGSRCETRSCPGDQMREECRGELFWIYSKARTGSCSSDVRQSCRGKPIRNLDTVFLLYSTPAENKAYWVSHDDGWITTRTCPGRYIEHCRCEAWQIFQKW
ncbi:SE-cephalotoxin-like [Protopterus annectens]|uniref:SE-cephalotoxin-like n=1 Tax=Protopterus annectens TaxID=7888 RepID=UPI001CFB3599|nr:SE-cephalotoxin-like [Protopterus annectens]